MDFSKTFKDTLGREWKAELHLMNLDDLEEAIGMPLDALVPKSDKAKSDDNPLMSLAEFLGDPRRVFAAFYALIKPQSDKLQLDAKGVKAGLGSEEAMMSMSQAVLRAFHDFFPMDPARRAILKKLAAMGQNLMDQVEVKISNNLNKIDLQAVLDAMPERSAEEINANIAAQFAKPVSGVSATSA